MLKIATSNLPARLSPHFETLDWCERKGADIVLAQEHTDKDNWANQDVYNRFRPKRARSCTIYYKPSRLVPKNKGAKRLSSPGFYSLRYLVWHHFRTVDGDVPIRVGNIHLPAFKTSNPRAAVEFRRQEALAAKWLSGGKNRVLGGDFNAQVRSRFWCPNLREVGQWSDAVSSGPKGQKIDYVGSNKVNGRWEIVDTELGFKFNSDHNVVLATLEWKG